MRDLGLDWRALSLDEVRVIYIRRLRETAAGRSGDDQQRLTQARAREANASANLKEVDLAQRLGVLVPATDAEADKLAAFAAVRSEILAIEDRLNHVVELETGARIKPEIIRSITRGALANLAAREGDSSLDGETELAGISATV